MSVFIGGIDDLSDAAVDRLLKRSTELLSNGLETTSSDPPLIVGLAFLEASLRTRVGFAVAASRLGWTSVEVNALRSTPTSHPEPWTETLRVLSGMVDVVIARPGQALDPATTRCWATCPVLNGGDIGPDAEHPSQALIDLFAIEQLVGPIGELSVAVCGDLRMRSSRSFLRLLARKPPRRLIVITDTTLPADPLPHPLDAIAEWRCLPDVDDVEVINVLGIPDGATDRATRGRLQVTREALDRLPQHAAVLSPMPILDEIETAALNHPRIKLYEQSDLAIAVRIAILEQISTMNA